MATSNAASTDVWSKSPGVSPRGGALYQDKTCAVGFERRMERESEQSPLVAAVVQVQEGLSRDPIVDQHMNLAGLVGYV